MIRIEPMELTVQDFHKALKRGDLTVKELVLYYIQRIETLDRNGPRINAVIAINPNALEEAEALDAQFAKTGLTGPLHGVPILLKDNVETHDMVTTAGSLSLKNYLSDSDAFIVQKMRAAGAIILAKANLHEFAIWGESISSILGQTLNPYDLTRTPGGSSGGTGAGLAANFALLGIGTDTINSVRSPASANALVGIRPTLGLVSRSGIVPYSYTQDTAGPLARTVADAVLLLDVIRGYDMNDSQTAWSFGQIQKSLTASLNKEGLKGKRIGILKHFLSDEHAEPIISQVMKDAFLKMTEGGSELVYLDTPFDADQLVKEVSVHLFDLKDHLNNYLSKINSSASVHSVEALIASGAYHPGIEDNLKQAASLSTDTDVYRKRLVAAAEVRLLFLKMMADNTLDAVVYPHQRQLVCTIGKSQEGRNGVLASVTGFPSICVPAGYSEPTDTAPIGVPIGLEIMGRPYSESTLIEIACGYESISCSRKSPILV